MTNYCSLMSSTDMYDKIAFPIGDILDIFTKFRCQIRVTIAKHQIWDIGHGTHKESQYNEQKGVAASSGCVQDILINQRES